MKIRVVFVMILICKSSQKLSIPVKTPPMSPIDVERKHVERLIQLTFPKRRTDEKSTLNWAIQCCAHISSNGYLNPKRISAAFY